MAQAFSLTASTREITGKRVRRLRREGVVPGVIYGTVVETPIPITVDERELQRTYQAVGSYSLIDLNLDGETHTVYIRNVQTNPVKRAALHAEFFAPDLNVAMTAAVPLHLVGEPQNDKLVLMHVRDSVELRGLPAALPGAIDVDISGLATVEDSILVSDIAIPADVEIVTDPSEMIVRLTEATMEVEEEEVEGEEVEIEGGEAPEEAATEDSGEEE